MGETEESDNKTSRVNNNHCDNPNNDLVYHAVYIPRDSEGDAEGEIHVYTDKQAALAVIKTSRTGRLKTFKSRLAAEKYAEHGFEEAGANKLPKVQVVNAEEKASSFRAPRSQELVIFRKHIERGELDTVIKMAWENPRYLISSGDTPAILQEGCRYNALHIASSKTQEAQMCEKLLEIVSDPKFVELLYGKGCKSTYETTAKIWLDLYLNTPDKGLNETPLHFAAKYGKIEVVKVLLSYPQCLKTVKNKCGQTPIQVVCSRKGQDDESLAREIRMLFEDQYYVPVWRAEDNSLQPTIGMPFSPSSPPRLKIDPLSPKVEVKAMAGPMPKSQAIEFRRKWKTPPRMSRTPTKTNDHNDSFTFLSPRSRDPGVRLQNTEKGLETVGRELAHEYQVNWSEWWPFMNDAADLSCIEGLSKLERYFRTRSTRLQEDKVKLEAEKATKMSMRNAGKGRRRLTSDRGDGEEIGDNGVSEELDDMEMLIKQLEMCSLNRSTPTDTSTDSDADEKFQTPPETPQIGSDAEDSGDDYSLAEEDDAVYDNLFIDGSYPGKNDIDVINAMPETIDAEIFPLIYRWKHDVELARKRNQVVVCTPRRRLLLTPEK
ncbi:ankyrin repeat and LEM domain-containing protein 2 isoform X2 [Diachasma alloeum]|uniref:ankyrin repeat and LEM domain-containing protein 2 isoform X2 n=1 Tax=Diachasma alloeum TaxID=454923 RepID=UPI0007385069|nr:ankyrin repeat and LEM domain-containing protein 2 isoform X2 [Diachasma alloeum]